MRYGRHNRAAGRSRVLEWALGLALAGGAAAQDVPTSPVLAVDLGEGGGVTTVTLSPAPPTEESLSFHPPLCVEDAHVLCVRASGLLSMPEDIFTPQRREAARRMIESARDYCDFLDNRHSSLGSYKWFRLATQRVPGGGRPVEDAARLTSQIANVSAIAYEASGSDVWIWSITVTGLDDQETSLTVTAGNIAQGMPWTVVTYLPGPTTIKRITTRRQTFGKSAELTLYAGVTREPEYGRRVIYQLGRALDALNSRLDDDALASLTQAREAMVQFNREQIERLRPDSGWLLGRTRRAAGRRP